MVTGLAHGYIAQNSVLQTYDVPGPQGPQQTNIYEINPAGDFVGIYIGSGGHRHGFLQLSDGSAPITLNYPDAVHTRACGVNPGLSIVGHCIDTSGHNHGFLAVSASNSQRTLAQRTKAHGKRQPRSVSQFASVLRFM